MHSRDPQTSPEPSQRSGPGRLRSGEHARWDSRHHRPGTHQKAILNGPSRCQRHARLLSVEGCGRAGFYDSRRHPGGPARGTRAQPEGYGVLMAERPACRVRVNTELFPSWCSR